MIQHYVTFLFPGSFFPEESNVKIQSREDKFDIPKGCFAYFFRDRKEVEDGKDLLTSDWINKSPRTYFGKVFNEQQVEALVEDKGSLLFNRKANGWKELVKTRRGNWQPIEEGDVVIAE